MAEVADRAIADVAGSHGTDPLVGTLRGDAMATAGTIVLEIKIAIDIVLAEDGKYYVDAATMKATDTPKQWTEGPFETEAMARETLKWQIAIPVIEKL